MSAYQGALGLARERGLVSPDYLVLEPGEGTDPPYLAFLFRSVPFVGEISARIRGIGSIDQGNVRTPRINAGELGSIPVSLPSVKEQRRIAGFLDAETARIDALIAKKRRLIAILNERRWSHVENAVEEIARSVPRVPLRRFVLHAADGPFGSALTSAHYSTEGARVVRLGNIGRNEWRDADSVFVPHDYWLQLSRHHAVGGDVIVAALGDDQNPVGRACVLPEGVGSALVKADCFCIRFDHTLLPAFAALFLSSSGALGDARRVADGATRVRLTLGKVLSLAVPRISLRDQERVVSEMAIHTTRLRQLNRKIERQVRLLAERRQALITAAVTGEFRVAA
ncbi:MAG: restriction endonuclease subunit S [Thermoleophilia bacterium]